SFLLSALTPDMPLSLRFVVPLALALAAIAYAVVPLVDRLTFQWFVRDLDARGALIAQTAQEPLSELMRDPRGARARVQRYVERRSADTKKYVLWLFAGIAAVVALITMVIAEISWRGWVAGLKALMSGETLLRSPLGLASTAPELRPIARDLQTLVRDLEA